MTENELLLSESSSKYLDPRWDEQRLGKRGDRNKRLFV